jgi:hypothetical protein
MCFILIRGIATHVINEGHATDVQMFPVKGILQQLHDVIADSVLSAKALCPCQELAGVQCRLLDREGEREAQRDGSGGRSIVGVRKLITRVGEEGINRVGEVI